VAAGIQRVVGSALALAVVIAPTAAGGKRCHGHRRGEAREVAHALIVIHH
jgi:hypothetical protein